MRGKHTRWNVFKSASGTCLISSAGSIVCLLQCQDALSIAISFHERACHGYFRRKPYQCHDVPCKARARGIHES